jgi:hypothetical protein
MIFIILRFFTNIIWVAYAIEINSMLINNIVTVISSIFIGYYKVVNYYSEQNENKIHIDNQNV